MPPPPSAHFFVYNLSVPLRLRALISSGSCAVLFFLLYGVVLAPGQRPDPRAHLTPDSLEQTSSYQQALDRIKRENEILQQELRRKSSTWTNEDENFRRDHEAGGECDNELSGPRTSPHGDKYSAHSGGGISSSSREQGGRDTDEMGPSPLPKMLSLETSLVQDVRRSLKVLRNDLDVIVDLLDQKLGIKREETELVDESTLARRKAEELRRRKLEKGYVQGNICRSHVAKDIGSSIVHAGVKVMLLSKTLEDDLQGDRWQVNIVGTSRTVTYHELEILCDPIDPTKKPDSAIASEEFDAQREWDQYGVWIYFRKLFGFLFFALDVMIWTSMQLFLDSVHNKKRRKKVLTDAELLARKRLKSLGAEGRTRWEILLQEDILAKYVDEYLGKVGISFGIACGIRVMNWVLDPEGLVASLTTNLIITLRCLAVVTFFIKDDLLMPNN